MTERGTLRLQTPPERPSSVAGSTGPPGVSHQKTVKNGPTKEYDPHGSAPQGAGRDMDDMTWFSDIPPSEGHVKNWADDIECLQKSRGHTMGNILSFIFRGRYNL